MGAPAARIITGPARAGKTAALVARVSELLAAGVPAGDVLLLAPTHDAACELRLRLDEALAGVEGAPEVRSVRGLAFELAGRPRVLARVERSVLLADLRARGFSASELSGALARVEAAWARGEDPQAQDDVGTRALLAELEVRSCTLPEALEALSLARLRSAAGEARGRVAHVLVEDAHLMTRGQLALACALATSELLVCARAPWTVPEGMLAGDLECGLGAHGEQTGGAGVVGRVTPGHRMGAGRAHVVKWTDVDEEAAGVAAFVDTSLRRLECEPGDAFVVCPNRAWRRRVREALSRASLASSEPGCERLLPGDPRDARGCLPLRMYAGLGLVADATDVCAWRAWCATGHADLSAVAWETLERRAAEGGMGVVQMLAQAASKPDEQAFEGSGRLAAEYAAALDVMGRCGRKTGRALVQGVDRVSTPAFRELVCADSGSLTLADDAARLCARAQGRIADAGFAPRASAVRVGSAADLAGLHPRVLVVAGANEGLLGASDVLAAFALPADDLLVSFVQRMDAGVARKAGACVRRVRREGATEVALLARPAGLDALGGELPSTMSGQQFCSAVLGLRP